VVTIEPVSIASIVAVVEVLIVVVSSTATLIVEDEVTKAVRVVAVTVVVELTVALTVMVILGAGAVIAVPETPMQEHALAYFIAPEQVDAYVGAAIRETVTLRFAGRTTVEVVTVVVKRSVTSMVSVPDSVNVVT
jgi:hypothetical protein